jgi:hypothetical protein
MVMHGLLLITQVAIIQIDLFSSIRFNVFGSRKLMLGCLLDFPCCRAVVFFHLSAASNFFSLFYFGHEVTKEALNLWLGGSLISYFTKVLQKLVSFLSN